MFLPCHHSGLFPGVPDSRSTDGDRETVFLFYSHSGFRYLALLSGLAIIGYAAYGLATGKPHDRTLYRLALTFKWMLFASFFVGVALVSTSSQFRGNPGLGMHIVTMLLATIVSYIVPAVMRRRPPAERSQMPYIVATVVAFALVAFGTITIGRPIIG